MGPAGQPGTLLTTCHADESGLAIGHHASSRTDPDDADCDAGVCGLTVRDMQPREPGCARRVPGRKMDLVKQPEGTNGDIAPPAL
jgi:hypothetical protein